MSRPIAGASLLDITTKLGTKPQILLTITYGGPSIIIQNHATKEMVVGGTFYEGSILEVGNFQSRVRRSGAAVTSTVSFKLSDTSGNLKSAYDNAIIERCDALVSLYYEGRPLANAITLIRGSVCGPVLWDETDRTISFSVETPIEEIDLGYAPTTGDIADLDPDANGIPWPMIFGSVAHSPCLKIKKRAQGTLLRPIQLYKLPPYLNDTSPHQRDFLLDVPDVYALFDDTASAGDGSILTEKNQIYIDGLASFPASSVGSPITIKINDVFFKGYADTSDANGQTFKVTAANAPKYTDLVFGNRVGTDPDINFGGVAWLAADGISIANCGIYVHNSLGKIWYNYCVAQEGRKCYFRNPFFDPATGANFVMTASNTIDAVYSISKCGFTWDVESFVQTFKASYQAPKAPDPTRGAFALGKAALDDAASKTSTWWRAEADSVVWPENADPDTYVASLIQLSEIKAVYGKQRIKTHDNKTKIVFIPIPESYYTAQLVSTYPFVGQHASIITFATPLTAYAGQDWEDDVYVSAKSTVGPNIADIIKFIVDKSTGLVMDAASYTAVRTTSRNAHFTLFDKRDALKVVEEIAFQARFGVIIDSGAVELRALSKQPFTPALQLTDNNVDLKGGVELHATPLAEITTKIVASWTPDYREKRANNRFNERKTHQIEEIIRHIVPDARRSFSLTQFYIYQNNQDLFKNRRPISEQFYIFKEEKYVKEAADFWGYRLSNCWKKINVKGFPDSLLLQPYDLVVVTFGDASLIAAPIQGIVTATNFNWQEMSVTSEIEFAVKAGGWTQDYAKYWPGDTAP